MHSLRPNKTLLSPESALASEIFDQFVNASTFKSILNLHRQMCDTLRIKPSTFPSFYVKLKSKLRSWKAASLWAKLDKRAGHKCYNRGKAASGMRVLIIGAGPCGLRTAIEAQLLGAKVVVVEKRDRFSRNNVLHLWPFVIHDLRNLGAKKFYGKFCAGSIDHISIRQLQCILLKVALLLGVEIHETVGFESLIEPPIDQSKENIGWRASVSPADHPVSQYEFGVLIGGDGKRNTLSGFKKKEFRGKLAIAITANFINKHSLEEARVEEISGVAFIFNQKFFHDLRDATGIDLENIVYYKDETHYFVMTAKKQSLIYKGVILNDYSDTVKLLSPDNVDREQLMAYAREAADFSTNYKMPHLDFAVNHYGQPDIAMFDFTSMYAAENASQVIERRGHKLLLGLVGDTLLEPFWPTGSGCGRGFLSAFDATWMIRSFASGKLSILQVLAERECVYRLLGQTTPENLSKDFNGYTLNPATRYPRLNVQKVQPRAVKLLYDSDVGISEQPMEIVIPDMSLSDDVGAIPVKRKRKDATMNPDMLLAWCQRQVALYDVQIENMSSSWRDGIALASILHRYRPDLIDVESMKNNNIEKNNNLISGIMEKDYGILSVITGKEMAEIECPDPILMTSYIAQVYEIFKGEIPYVVRDFKETSPENDQPVDNLTPKKSNPPKTSFTNRSSNKTHHKRLSSDKSAHSSETLKRARPSSADRIRNIDQEKMARLFSYDDSKISLQREKPALGRLQDDPAQFKDRCKLLEDKIRHDFGMITREERRAEEDEIWKNKKPPVPIGKIEGDQWNVKMLEEKLKALKDGKPVQREKQYHVDGSRLTQTVFDSKVRLKNIDAKLKSNGRDLESEKKYDRFDAKMKALDKKLRVGPDLDIGIRGNNKVSLMASQLSKPSDSSSFYAPISKSTSSKSVYLGLGVHGSEMCYFCKQRVYLMERMSAEGLFFHHGCFKCEYCGTALRLGGYAFDRTGQFGGEYSKFSKSITTDFFESRLILLINYLLLVAWCVLSKFYCQAHFGMQRIEKPKYTRHVISRSATDGSVPTTANSSKFATSPISPISNMSKLGVQSAETANRGFTPERAEFENSYADMTSEDELSELDEDEWTERNFGSSFEQDTSDDDYSDLSSTDSDTNDSLEEEVERSMTVDETRRLAERWNRRYSQETLVDVGGVTDEDLESNTETDSEQESEIFSSEEEFVKAENRYIRIFIRIFGPLGLADVQAEIKCRSSSEEKTPAGGSGSTSSTVHKDEKEDVGSLESLNSEDYSSYSDTDSEEPLPVHHEIPEIVIEEMLSKPLNSDEEHLVPEAVEAFQSPYSVYKNEKPCKLNNMQIDIKNQNQNQEIKSPPNEICVKIRSAPLASSPKSRNVANSIGDTKYENRVDIDSKVFMGQEGSPLQTVIENDSLPSQDENKHLETTKKIDDNLSQGIFIKTVTGPVAPPRSRLGLLKAKCRDDERRHTSPVSLRDISRAKEEFLKCGGDAKKRSSSPVKKDALFKTLQSIEQLQRVLESPPLTENKKFGSGDALDRLQRSIRSLSPERKPVSTINSRFRTFSDYKNRIVSSEQKDTIQENKSYILSKTVSTSCVPSNNSNPESAFNPAKTNYVLSKALSSSRVPAQDNLGKITSNNVDESTILTKSNDNDSEKLNLSCHDKVDLNVDYAGVSKSAQSHVNVGDTLKLTKDSPSNVFEAESDNLLKKNENSSINSKNLLSPNSKRKHKDDIMLDSESMSSTSTLNEDYVSYKNTEEQKSNIQLSNTKNMSVSIESASLKHSVELDDPIFEIEYDKDADDFSGSDWAHDDITSACEDDFGSEFGFSNRNVTIRDKPYKVNASQLSWDDEMYIDQPAQVNDKPASFHAAFVQSISCDEDFESTPVASDKQFIDSDQDDTTPIIEVISPLCTIPCSKNDSNIEKLSSSLGTSKDILPFASLECIEKGLTTLDNPISSGRPTSKSLESVKQFSLCEITGSDDSLYHTPDTNMNTKYKGYTGNFAKKVSPFGSILDSVLKKKSLSSKEVLTRDCDKNEAAVDLTKDENDISITSEVICDKTKLKLDGLSFEKFGAENKITRRRSIHGDTPKNSCDDEIFFTPATSRKKIVDKRPWSVYGTPTETRKVILPYQSTPKNSEDVNDFRQLTTAERDKLREEARRRARLKSDEELGLTPSYFSRKYNSRTESLSEQPEISDKASLSQESEPEILIRACVSEKSDISDISGNFPVETYNHNVVAPVDEYEKSFEDSKTSTIIPIAIEIESNKSDDSKSHCDKNISPSHVELKSTKNVEKTSEFNSLKLSEDTLPPIIKSEQSQKSLSKYGDSSTSALDSFAMLDHSSENLKNIKTSEMVKGVSSFSKSSSNATKPIQESQLDSSSRDSTLDIESNSRNNTLERDKKKKWRILKKEPLSGEEDKQPKRKSFFAMLSLAKSPENAKKQEKNKDTSSNLSSVNNSSTPKSSSAQSKTGKERSFLKLRLNRSKEKFREKKKECDRGEALVPSVVSSTDDISTPVTMTEEIEVKSDKNLVKGATFPPQASDDSFTESDGKSQRFALTAEQLLNRTELTERIVTETLLNRRPTKEKEHEDRQQKLQKIAKKVQKQQEWKRHRLAQEIQRSLEELDVKRRELEQQGIKLEKTLSKQDNAVKDKNSDVMNDWLTMVHQKSKLNNEEEDLLIRLKELQLEDRHSRLQKDLRNRMAVDDSEKEKFQIDEERKILKEMLEIVEERDAMVEVLEENRLKQVKADKEFNTMMQSKRHR
ncbi:[F-actin]-monooxygenase MICAL3 [Nymphon striatum]|nr:[F-actin]-monooxygenase MICAL3 [Nymphon striatum]